MKIRVRTLRRLISEALSGTSYAGSPGAYRMGYSPGYKFGPSMGGFKLNRPARGPEGGSALEQLPNPYAGELSAHIEAERETAWAAEVEGFMGRVGEIKRAIGFARTSDAVMDAARLLVPAARDPLIDIVEDAGAVRAMIERGSLEPAKRALMVAIDGWAKRLVSRERIMGMGAGALDPFAHANGLVLSTAMGGYDGQ